MATVSAKYTYNLPMEYKEDWYVPEFWPAVQKTETNFKEFQYKDDDVIICTYPRSGTHMTWLIVRYLLQGNTSPITDAMEDSHLPPTNPINKQEGRRVFNSHYLPANFGEEFINNGKHKMIHVARNPKDSMVSMFHIIANFKKFMPALPDTWEEFVPFVLTTDISLFNWPRTMRAWEEFTDKNPGAPVLNLKFEEIVKEPKTVIKQIAKFLDVELSDSFLQDLLIASKFENMKDAPISEEVKKIVSADNKDFSYYRKGKIGDWVNKFTVAQNELVDATYKEQMKGSKVTAIYE